MKYIYIYIYIPIIIIIHCSIGNRMPRLFVSVVLTCFLCRASSTTWYFNMLSYQIC